MLNRKNTSQWRVLQTPISQLDMVNEVEFQTANKNEKEIDGRKKLIDIQRCFRFVNNINNQTNRFFLSQGSNLSHVETGKFNNFQGRYKLRPQEYRFSNVCVS